MQLISKQKFNKVNIEISNICNLQCTFCPEVIRTKKMMEPELFRTIIKQVAPITEQVCFHLMGEPLVHPKLDQFIQICAEENVPVFFVSNGVLLNEKRAELLLNPIIRQVNFSLHSFHDNYPDRDSTEYLQKIFAFTERAFIERPELYINYRLWNLQETQGTANGKSDLNRNMLATVAERFGASLDSVVDVKKKKSHRLKNRLYLHYDTEFVWPSPDLPVLGENGTCLGLSQHFGILVDGTVVPCCLDKEGNIPLGKVQDSSIEEILSSKRAQDILMGFKQRKLKENLCQRCQYVTRFGT